MTFSKYTGIIGRSGSTTVAKWDVSIDTADNSSDTIDVVSDAVTGSYIVKVINKSEVSSTYSISLSNVPADLEVSLDGGTYQTPINNVVTFNNAGTFVANDAVDTHTHVLTFNDPASSSNDGLYNISINVNLVQTH